MALVTFGPTPGRRNLSLNSPSVKMSLTAMHARPDVARGTPAEDANLSGARVDDAWWMTTSNSGIVDGQRLDSAPRRNSTLATPLRSLLALAVANAWRASYPRR